MNEIGVLADPTESRVARQGFFQHGRAIGEHAISLLLDHRGNALAEFGEPRAQHLVIVAAERVAGDVTRNRVGKRFMSVARLFGKVIHTRRDHAQGAGDQFLRSRAAQAMTLHVIHLAVELLGKPIDEMLSIGVKRNVTDADLLKAELDAPRLDLPRKCGVMLGTLSALGAHRSDSIMSRMAELPISIRSVQQVRALDRYAIERLGIPAYVLMTRAGEAALACLRSCWPAAQRCLILCGFGNNAGDGYVLARLALEAKLEAIVVALADPAKLTEDARHTWQDFIAAGGATVAWRTSLLADAEVVVDAIFGTGLSRPLETELQRLVREVNASEKPVLSLDVPSGLNADTGHVLGAAIAAERTLSFVGLKQGFYLGDGPNHTGIVMFDDLDIPPAAAAQIGCVAQRMTMDCVKRALPRRRRTAHKGQQGRVLVIGGGIGMAGAARLAGEACLRVGAGLVTVAAHPDNVAAIVASRPELMCRGVSSGAELQSLLDAADLVAIGPGLGRSDWANAMLAATLQTALPLVIDADALNILAEQPVARGHWVMTPHPGEAARLLGCTTAEIQTDRMNAARRIVAEYGGTVVLKGAGTLVLGSDELPFICDRGNPGMAIPGMGDVLTGTIAGIAAQCGELWPAAAAGVYAHATAGDMAARHGERGLLASDLFDHLPACVNP